MMSVENIRNADVAYWRYGYAMETAYIKVLYDVDTNISAGRRVKVDDCCGSLFTFSLEFDKFWI